MISHMASQSLKLPLYSIMMQFFQSPWVLIQTLAQEYPPKEKTSSLKPTQLRKKERNLYMPRALTALTGTFKVSLPAEHGKHEQVVHMASCTHSSPRLYHFLLLLIISTVLLFWTLTRFFSLYTILFTIKTSCTLYFL